MVTQLRKWKKSTDIDAIHTQILKIDNIRDSSKDDLEMRIKTLLEEDKIKNNISNNLDSFDVNKETINIEPIGSK